MEGQREERRFKAELGSRKEGRKGGGRDEEREVGESVGYHAE